MTDQSVGLASIGLGWWGGVLAEAAAKSATMVACYARDPESRAQFAEKHGCRAAADLEEIWSDPEIDGVMVATPHQVRLEIVEAAAAAGKHVFVEKPLALTGAEARACAAAAEAAGVVLQVGHNKRRQTANRKLAELVHGGDLGDLQYIETHISVPVAFKPSVPEWRQQPEQLPAAGMTPLGVHMVDAIGYLGGAVSEVFTMSRRVYGRYAVEDVTSVVLGLESGPLASLTTLMAVGPVTTIGAYGTEACAWSEGDGVRLYIQPRGAAERTEEKVETIDTVADELAEYAACIRSGDKPETGAPEGVAVAAILEAIVESAETNAPAPVR